ncbi:Mini-ribonuclease 3 [Effusibacillus dendaii]|uniref:Mini-ribonuclease 3 n=1 Tax=Effusibacillus dendaii TaxID=2743772 RepID=A0A7I8DEH6_9BACL|nr:ribonuclease III domain-containing protein [Effusibacillus dendaii]BCJ87359.1 mini-ribonuclease 3 [Effusibacillus dendaii]
MVELKTGTSRKPQEMPALALAYLGDGVWELFVRQHLLAIGEMRPHRLQKASVSYVKAKAQADILHHLKDDLTEEEMGVVRRGRNAKSGTVPKHADVIDYRHSTGFESLCGYLFLKGEFERLRVLAEKAIHYVDTQLRKDGEKS